MARAYDWGECPWQLEREASGRPAPSRVDVAVIGGGLTGLACALTLARAGREVVVLEASRIGAGASGRTGGLVLEGTAGGILPGTGRCIPHLRDVIAREHIDCDLRLGGCWELVHREPTDTGSPGWRDVGAERRRFVVDETVAGGTLDAGALVIGLAGAAEHAGARLCEDTPVFRLGFAEDDGESAVDLGDRFLHATHVVLALGGFTRRLLPAGPGFDTALTLAVRTESIPSEVFEAMGLHKDVPFYTTDRPYLWGRTVSERRAVFGAGVHNHPSGEPTRTGIHDADAAEIFETLERRVRGLHPGLRHIGFEQRWAGPVSFRERGHPVLYRYPDAPNVLVTGAYAGHGIALSCTIGNWAAHAIDDGRDLPKWGRP